MTPAPRPRVLIFIVAYYAESTILKVLERIPELPDYEVEVLIIDDCSADATFARSERLRSSGRYKHKLTVLANPANQGYGGNQKLGYHYAISHGFDHVVLVHGDGQYAPEILPEILAPLTRGDADVVLGSRMLTPGGARRGGMPLYKWLGNKILTGYQNLLLGSRLAEFHTGYKAYTTAVLRRIPFETNSNVFHFDTEIIIQLLRARARFVEVPIPTFYGDEICRVNGLRYAKDVVVATTVACLQDFGLLYRRNFDVTAPAADAERYQPKLHFPSTHTAALAEISSAATVLDVGGGGQHLVPALRERGCRVIGIDPSRTAPPDRFDEFYSADPAAPALPRSLADVDVILLLDVIEHLVSPEAFCAALRRHTQQNRQVKIIVSTANIGFCVTRLMLLFGQFNYNKRGILDLTHTRLFTFASLRRLLRESGFTIERELPIPAPIPLVVKPGFTQRFLMTAQALAMKVSRGLFAYQMLFVVRPLPTVETLLAETERHSAAKTATTV
jgi:glycosyltransferase involved in cell wall biosynthesis